MIAWTVIGFLITGNTIYNNVLLGYNFTSLKSISPYLEPTECGPTSKWARSTAQRLGCVVCVGYPEIAGSKPSTADDASSEPRPIDALPGESDRFNSLFIVDSLGNTLSNYQKRFLYYTDDNWAHEGKNGEGFLKLPVRDQRPVETMVEEQAYDQPNISSSKEDRQKIANSASSHTIENQIPTSVGICMDINPYKFVAPYSAYEFANQVRLQGSKLVIVSMAWLTLLDREELQLLADKPDMDTFQYWVRRFWPLIYEGEEREITIVFANRCGEEPGLEGSDTVRYAGTSCVLGIRRRRDATQSHEPDTTGEDWRTDVEIVVWDILGRAEEGICFVDTNSVPKKVFKVQNP